MIGKISSESRSLISTGEYSIEPGVSSAVLWAGASSHGVAVHIVTRSEAVDHVTDAIAELGDDDSHVSIAVGTRTFATASLAFCLKFSHLDGVGVSGDV